MATTADRDQRNAATNGGTLLLDRVPERWLLKRLLQTTRNGGSGALVVRGEPGIGKTALLDYAVRSAAGVRVRRLIGVESELRLPFAALQQLLGPMLSSLKTLPDPQRKALASAFGLGGGTSPGMFHVGLGALNVLSQAATERPLLCVIDDAHWIDRSSAHALAFVARRLDADAVALVFALREPLEAPTPLEGLPELRLTGLATKHSRQLLGRAVASRLDRNVCDRVIHEAGGNPLALLAIAAELTPAQLSGASSLPEPLPVGERLEHALLRRVRALPAQTQSLMLLVAADPTGGLGLITRAAALLSIPPDAATSAESAGVLKIQATVTFPHPLIRSAVYGAAAAEDRRRVHWALAEATDEAADEDRRAWHRAAASPTPDARIASDLERAAGRVKARGGYAAQAVLLERAAELTAGRHRRSERKLAAARAHFASGCPAKASALLDTTVPELIEPFHLAQAEKLRGELARELRVGPAAATLLHAARRFEPLDSRLARDTHLAALEASIWAGPLGGSGSLREAGMAAQSAPPASTSRPTASDLLLDGVGTLLVGGHGAAAPTLRLALAAIRREENLHCFRLGIFAASELWDDEALRELTMRQVQLARDAGALTRLPLALYQLGAYETNAGRFAAAVACFDEAGEIAASVGNRSLATREGPMTVLVEAWRGRDVRALAETCARDAAGRGLTGVWRYVKYALAVLENGLGRYAAALAGAQDAVHPETAITSPFPELAEAAARTGATDLAASAVKRLADATLPSGTPWGLGALAQARALVAPDSEAEQLYRDAIDHLTRCDVAPQLGRAKLLYGEWLRRQRRTGEAREQLRSAHELLGSMGAAGFAGRARAELLATGVRITPRATETEFLLTPQEARIAELARAGSSNPQIAAQLFISRRTVEYHLHKVFRKLGVSSRAELDEAFPTEPGRDQR